MQSRAPQDATRRHAVVTAGLSVLAALVMVLQDDPADARAATPPAGTAPAPSGQVYAVGGRGPAADAEMARWPPAYLRGRRPPLDGKTASVLLPKQ